MWILPMYCVGGVEGGGGCQVGMLWLLVVENASAPPAQRQRRGRAGLALDGWHLAPQRNGAGGPDAAARDRRDGHDAPRHALWRWGRARRRAEMAGMTQSVEGWRERGGSQRARPGCSSAGASVGGAHGAADPSPPLPPRQSEFGRRMAPCRWRAMRHQ